MYDFERCRGEGSLVGTSGPQEQQVGEFSCWLIYPSLVAKESDNLEMPMITDKNKPQQKSVFSSQRTRKTAT